MFVRWFAGRDGFEHARERQRELADGSVTGATVGFAPVEVAGVLRNKGLLAGRLTPAEFAGAARVIGDTGDTPFTSRPRTGWSMRRCCPLGE